MPPLWQSLSLPPSSSSFSSSLVVFLLLDGTSQSISYSTYRGNYSDAILHRARCSCCGSRATCVCDFPVLQRHVQHVRLPFANNIFLFYLIMNIKITCNNIFKYDDSAPKALMIYTRHFKSTQNINILGVFYTIFKLKIVNNLI